MLSIAGPLTGAGGGDATSTVFGDADAAGFSGNFTFGPVGRLTEDLRCSSMVPLWASAG